MKILTPDPSPKGEGSRVKKGFGKTEAYGEKKDEDSFGKTEAYGEKRTRMASAKTRLS